ncbi:MULTISPECIES: flagellar basal body-associated protein FliL [Pseudomonas]|jgi:flagellar FliL protein|uniref:Flagellar protein FliL n=1 Tax=Pseudomonas veronii TaxID=76761 RepID=A0A7Y1ABS7_PSEVE|nr:MULTISPECIES: flagellar basal body-associated protein FliL [Pseudomonas]AQY68347.1 flagellar basal body protein FliL [Pseudomonas veronii]MBJ2182745.1 flagellar basal body-associated protein FliL [Pseudomonas veronii]MCT8960362.1 flagellar basal body-associated protein FliL [Pseudomonas veronii]NMX40088.1 flagellar basal body-associated protein FliL [Pseudomonas veronii]NMX53835.1 flagellar basal body-associated protein FliL [Pseudomonas veronii]
MTTTRKTPWLLILLLALVVVAASSGGTYLYFSQHGMAAEAVTVEPVAQKPQAPRLVTIAPMTVNLVNERDEQSLLYVGFALEVADDATQALLQQYMPQIRSQLLTLLSGQNTTQVITPQGKAALAGKVLETLKQPLAPQQPAPAVLRVLYTDFIVQ